MVAPYRVICSMYPDCTGVKNQNQHEVHRDHCTTVHITNDVTFYRRLNFLYCRTRWVILAGLNSLAVGEAL